jgi:hypothetical protein
VSEEEHKHDIGTVLVDVYLTRVDRSGDVPDEYTPLTSYEPSLVVSRALRR